MTTITGTTRSVTADAGGMTAGIDQLCVNTIRTLSMDAVQQANSGHPGTPMALAPVIFNFHGYPWLIHKLAYRFKNHENMHVRGYKEKGNINTPLELAIINQVDRFNLVIDVIDRVPGLAERAAHCKEDMKNAIILNLAYARSEGTDRAEITNWVWPG